MRVWVYKAVAILLSALVLTASADTAFAFPKKLPKLKNVKVKTLATRKIPTARPNVAAQVERATAAQAAKAVTTPSVAPAPALQETPATPAVQDTGTKLKRTPGQVLAELELFIQKYQRLPLQRVQDPIERSLRSAVDNTITRTKNPQDSIILRLVNLKKEYSKRRMPQEVLEDLELFIKENNRFPSQYSQDPQESKLRIAINNTIRLAKDPQNSIIVQLTSLKQEYSKIRTPQQVLEELEQFIKEKNYFPSKNAEKELERSLRSAVDNTIKNAKDPQLSVIVRLTDLKKQWVKEITEARTPEQVLAELELFIKKNGRFPSQYAQDPVERSLRGAIYGAISRANNPQNPTIMRLVSLKSQYVKEHRTTEQVLTELELFIERNNRFPLFKDKNEHLLRQTIDNIITRATDPRDPTVMRLIALKKQWTKIYEKRKTAEEYVALARQYDRKPRAQIYRNGHILSREEMIPEEQQEVIVGIGLATNRHHPLVKAYMKENRKIAEKQTTEQLYTSLVNHIKDYEHYPTVTESSLHIIINFRLRYYQSTMLDGKYADPYLQKIYELKQWSERVKRGEVDWEQFPELFKKHRRTIGEMRAQGILPSKEAAKELEQLPAEEQQAIEQMADNMLTLWEDFESVWWQQNQKHIITTPQTQTAFNTVLNTVRNQVPGANNVNISNVLEQINSMQLGKDGPDYYRVIYRGNNPRIPRAEDFHNVEEITGLPQQYAQPTYKLNAQHISLDGDDEMVYNMFLTQGVTDREMSAVIDALTPAGWEVRIGAHEMLSDIKNGKVHIHLEQIVPTTEEYAMDISHVLNVNLRTLTRGKNPQQIAKTLRYLFAKYLKEDGHQALNNIQKAF